MITLRFVEYTDIISDGVRAAEYGFWASHAEALLPDGTLLGAHLSGGVAIRAGDYDAGTFAKQVFVTLPADAPTTAAFLAFITSQVGKPYDVEAIVSLVLERNWQDPKAWFCSELMASALVHCGWFSSPIATTFNKVTPRDLLLIVSGRVSTADAQALNMAASLHAQAGK